MTPVTGGENGLGLHEGAVPSFFGIVMHDLNAFYVCAGFMLVVFLFSIYLANSPYGLMLKAIKSNQTRLNYTGINTGRYKLSAFVLSAIFAGMAGALMMSTDPHTGADKLLWNISGEVVLMTVLGGVGTLLGPVMGAAFLKYFENVVSGARFDIPGLGMIEG